jgi:hypothetical protein
MNQYIEEETLSFQEIVNTLLGSLVLSCLAIVFTVLMFCL